MHIETTIKINFETQLGDTFTGVKLTQEEIDEVVNEHINDYCNEHNISSAEVEIVNVDVQE